MSYGFEMRAGIRSTYGNAIAPRKQPKKPRNPSTPDAKPIPKEKVETKGGDRNE